LTDRDFLSTITVPNPTIWSKNEKLQYFEVALRVIDTLVLDSDFISRIWMPILKLVLTWDWVKSQNSKQKQRPKSLTAALDSLKEFSVWVVAF
jgi:hypothetical protein